MMSLASGLQLAFAIALPLGGGFLGAIFTASEVKGWYTTLKRPWWNPPNWLFGPMWTVLYICMGIASWMVYQKGGWSVNSYALTLYLSQLAFNFAWSPLFFLAHWLDLALLDILIVLAGEILTVSEFSKVLGWPVTLALMGPLMMWTTVATALTLDIYRNNPQETGKQRSSDKIE